MKHKFVFLILIVLVLVAVFNGYQVLQYKRSCNDRLAALHAQWDAERAKLNDQLNDILFGKTIFPVDGSRLYLEPTELIRLLNSLPNNSKTQHLSDEEKTPQTRLAYYCARGLIELGDISTPYIKKYLESGRLTQLIGNIQHSRLCLVWVLCKIASPQAVKLLKETLMKTDQVTEFIQMAQIIQDANRNICHETIVAKARDILSDKKSWYERRFHLTELLKLAEYTKDELAKAIRAGWYRLPVYYDHDQMDLICKMLGEDSVNLLYSGFTNSTSSINNSKDTCWYVSEAIPYIGSNKLATEMFYTFLDSDRESGSDKSSLVFALVFPEQVTFPTQEELNNWSPTKNPMTPEMAQTRLEMLNNCETLYGNDPGIMLAIEEARKVLNYSRDPSAFESAPIVSVGDVWKKIGNQYK